MDQVASTCNAEFLGSNLARPSRMWQIKVSFDTVTVSQNTHWFYIFLTTQTAIAGRHSFHGWRWQLHRVPEPCRLPRFKIL